MPYPPSLWSLSSSSPRTINFSSICSLVSLMSSKLSIAKAGKLMMERRPASISFEEDSLGRREVSLALHWATWSANTCITDDGPPLAPNRSSPDIASSAAWEREGGEEEGGREKNEGKGREKREMGGEGGFWENTCKIVNLNAWVLYNCTCNVYACMNVHVKLYLCHSYWGCIQFSLPMICLVSPFPYPVILWVWSKMGVVNALSLTGVL